MFKSSLFLKHCRILVELKLRAHFLASPLSALSTSRKYWFLGEWKVGDTNLEK